MPSSTRRSPAKSRSATRTRPSSSFSRPPRPASARTFPTPAATSSSTSNACTGGQAPPSMISSTPSRVSPPSRPTPANARPCCKKAQHPRGPRFAGHRHHAGPGAERHRHAQSRDGSVSRRERSTSRRSPTLNQQIANVEIGHPGSAVDLRDQREAAIESLAADRARSRSVPGTATAPSRW